jgi:hypothetical protein
VSKEISIQELMRQMETLTASMSQIELRELLNGLARSQSVESRAAFLIELKALAEGSGEKEPVQADGPDALVARIEELADEAAERQEHIENGEYHELSDWDEDEYYRPGSWHDEPEVFSAEICDELKAICTQADHWVLDEEYGKALPVYFALFDLEKRAQEDEFFGSPYVCTMETGVHYCRCVCRVAPKAKRAESLFRAIVRVAESVPEFSRMDGSRVVPLRQVEDLFDDWGGLQKVVDSNDSWIALRLAVELLVRRGDDAAAEQRILSGGLETGPAWLWLLHDLHDRKQWPRLAECSRKAVDLLPDWFRTEALKMQVLAGAETKSVPDIADGLIQLFREQPTREKLAETVYRFRDQPDNLRAVFEKYELFLSGKEVHQQLLALARILLGRFDEVFAACVKKADPLGWAYQSPCGIAASAALFQISRSKNVCPPLMQGIIHQYLFEPSIRRWEEASNSGFYEECNRVLNDALSQALCALECTAKQQTSLLQGLCKLFSERADAIVSGKHRKSYGKAAEGLAAWAAASMLCGDPREGEGLIETFRQRYNRHRAFQTELNEKMKRL